MIEAADPYVLGSAVADAARRLRVPAVAFCHSDLPTLLAHAAGAPGYGMGRWAEQRAIAYLVRLYQRFDLVLAPSRTMMRKLHDWGVTHAVQQPLGVDTEVFTPAAGDESWRSLLERRLGLARGTRLLVYCGRFAAEKNLDVLAAALNVLGHGHALLAIGSGPRPPRGPHVRVFAPDADAQRLARLLASCDVFVHAGDQETFGLAALEAMACGTPVVVSGAGGLGELVDGVGTTVETLNPHDWADAIESRLARRDERLEHAALKRARSHDWDVVLNLLARRYRLAMAATCRAGETLALEAT